jgi:hypothetical protein
MGNETSSSPIIVDKSQRASLSSHESNPVKIRLKTATKTNRKNLSKNNNDNKQAFTDDRQTKRFSIRSIKHDLYL